VDVSTGLVRAGAPMTGEGWPAALSAAIWDACPAALVLVDRSGVVRAVNQAFATVHDAMPEALIGRQAWELLPMEVGIAALADLGPSSTRAATLPSVPEQVLVDAVGNRRRIAWSLAPITGADGRVAYLLATGVDLTRERTLQATLRERAESDALTGLANRAYLTAALAACLDPFRGAGASLLFCDLDGFKTVNDTLGHHVGDLVLQEVAQRLTRTCRPDDVIARLGGDEFVILVPGRGGFDAKAMTARLERALTRPMNLADHPVRVGVSIGVRVADPGENPAQVLQDADTAMYQRKNQRKNQRKQPRPTGGASP
jgi:diguanylate cyclase (GGDEF)-like protein/PAS domain S-box-containing protein